VVANTHQGQLSQNEREEQNNMLKVALKVKKANF
jgi:hypothetical protein